MSHHDPRRVIELLRDHLATHDRPISFLFGAGTSTSVAALSANGFASSDPPIPLVPTSTALTALCKDRVCSLGPVFAAAWASLEAECAHLEQLNNIENLLTRIHAKLDALTAADSLQGLTWAQWQSAEKATRTCIAAAVSPELATIPARLPHHEFARWVKHTQRRHAVEVFTTNYDLLLERTFDHTRLPHFDGFIGSVDPFFSAEAVEGEDLLPGPAWIRLWKLHGSVNWSIRTVGDTAQITRSQPGHSGEMILPSHKKYDQSRKQPYRALIDRLARVLTRPDSVLVTSGYSFSDQHINAVLFDVLDNHPRTHVIALKKGALAADDTLATAGIQRPNLVVIANNAGVLGARYGLWRLSTPLDDRTRSFMSLLFDSEVGSTDEGSELRGTVAAGDFARFATFLTSMTPVTGAAS